MQYISELAIRYLLWWLFYGKANSNKNSISCIYNCC